MFWFVHCAVGAESGNHHISIHEYERLVDLVETLSIRCVRWAPASGAV